MRRLLLPFLILSLGLTTGCRHPYTHTSGICDCTGGHHGCNRYPALYAGGAHHGEEQPALAPHGNGLPNHQPRTNGK